MKGIIIAAVLVIGGLLGLGYFIKQHTNLEGVVQEKHFEKGQTSVGTGVTGDGKVVTTVNSTSDEYTIFVQDTAFTVNNHEYFRIDKGDYVKIEKGEIVEIKKAGTYNE
ncbi:hypothetical protein [Priestia megaterium]|uniref:hypothetical protein n=1 Tax=Priestia megaterium TaxID=1404 RepID=UPI000BF7F2F9|nr:hypothetical protein [Priestia megaterium]PFW43776.1 hypothetical protein COL17_26575 [Priestia megaterium]